MRVIEVVKIKQESLNKLLDLGYTVKLVQVAPKSSVYANYKYNKPVTLIRPETKPLALRLEFDCLVCHKFGCAGATWHEKEK